MDLKAFGEKAKNRQNIPLIYLLSPAPNPQYLFSFFLKMNRCFILGLLLFFLLPWVGQAQYVSEIIEYQPAPGQLINTETYGSPQAAQSIIGNINGLVSLGAYGGSITLKMEEAVQNDPNNPFGIDFTIFGNALQDWSESGAVYVMKDENQNGLADDTWYLIAGSDYYFENTQNEFQIEYFKPHQDLDDILWIDQNQDSGYIFTNSIHQHAYYPIFDYFPQINQNSQIYTGLNIQGWVDQSNPGYIRSYKRGFGFADNQLRGSPPYEIPDNPYTDEVENSGGDAFDISWARDENGQQVFLDEIHFIKIITAINNQAGQLGEISTEIAGIIDVTPNNQITGETKCIVIQDLPHRILINSEQNLNALLFEKGIPMENQDIQWSSSSEEIANISNGKIIANHIGDFLLTATSTHYPNIQKSIQLSVNQAESLEIKDINQYLPIGEETEIETTVLDNQGFELAGLDLEYESSNENIEIINHSNKTFIKGISEGESWLHVKLTDFEDIKDSILVRVSSESQIPKVFVSVKTENETIFPRQAISIFPSNIENFIEPTNNQFQSNEANPENLAQAVISTFQKMNLGDEFRFKNDLDNNALYLWKVPIVLPSSLEYVYGYGGRTASPYERCWIVKLNEQNIVKNFQDIPVQDHDEITIYHISNVNENWNLKEFTSLSDSVEEKGDIQVQLQEFELQMYPNSQVYTLDQWPISSEAVFDNDSELWYNDNQVFTNSDGKAEFQLEQLGAHIISADGEEIKIYIKQATGIEKMDNSKLKIYPNPIEGDLLHFSIPEKNIQSVHIFNLSGQLLFTSTTETTNIFIPDLTTGTYFLQIRTNKSVYNQRFIKR